MTALSDLILQGTTNAWLYVPSAVALGALHGLEPGHSKTLMAAFIVAVRGTVGQAVLLGLSATVSHTAVVWLVALAGLYFGGKLDAERVEPYFQVASAVLIVAIALWILWRTWRLENPARRASGPAHHDHDHDHGHHHALGDAVQHLVQTVDPVYQDAHERAHAEDIRRRFANRHVSTGQIVMFGLTGGLVPCPASITVLLLCLQLKQFSLGLGLVLCFSIGLALTMVASGTLAALSVRQASKHWGGFGKFAHRAPYFSGGLLILVGLYTGYLGWQGVSALA